MHGWLAQPGERFVHTEEVIGSSPIPPTYLASARQSYLDEQSSERHLGGFFFAHWFIEMQVICSTSLSWERDRKIRRCLNFLKWNMLPASFDKR